MKNKKGNQKRHGGILDRKVGRMGPPLKRILIVCEGTKTEPKYFKDFRITSADVVVRGGGRVTTSLVDYALELKHKAEDPYDDVWCVFDKDDFQDFDQAITFAKANKIQVAYSNQSFELWFLLHFSYIDSSLHRWQYISMLSSRLGKPYEKNADDMYFLIHDKQEDSIRNAEQLLNTYGSTSPGKNNPSTTVHLLVKELKKLI